MPGQALCLDPKAQESVWHLPEILALRETYLQPLTITSVLLGNADCALCSFSAFGFECYQSDIIVLQISGPLMALIRRLGDVETNIWLHKRTLKCRSGEGKVQSVSNQPKVR